MLDGGVQLAAAGAAASVMLAAWLASLALRDASIADIAWGLCFIAIAWAAYAAGPGGDAALLIAGLITVWGLRLAGHIALRHDGEDPRYRAMRRAAGDAFWIRSLLTVFVLQGAIAFVVSLPVQLAAGDGGAGELGVVEWAGAAIALAGIATEGIADVQLTRFRAGPGGEGSVLDSGLWRFSRHPNYFGDSLFWWGIWVAALGGGAPWWTAVGPAAMTFLLLRVSGVALTEKSIADRRPAYRDYVERTSAFVPLPPRS